MILRLEKGSALSHEQLDNNFKELAGQGSEWDGKPYVDSKARGANPSAMIYPDGTISGKTDNGRYIRKPDGSLECSINSLPSANNTTNGATWWDFPCIFSDLDITCIPSCKGGSGQYSNHYILVPAVHRVSLLQQAFANGLHYNITAIGRWK